MRPTRGGGSFFGLENAFGYTGAGSTSPAARWAHGYCTAACMHGHMRIALQTDMRHRCELLLTMFSVVVFESAIHTIVYMHAQVGMSSD